MDKGGIYLVHSPSSSPPSCGNEIPLRAGQRKPSHGLVLREEKGSQRLQHRAPSRFSSTVPRAALPARARRREEPWRCHSSFSIRQWWPPPPLSHSTAAVRVKTGRGRERERRAERGAAAGPTPGLQPLAVAGSRHCCSPAALARKHKK
jgi:hypothetical protein